MNQVLNERFWNPRVVSADLILKANVQPYPGPTLTNTAAPLTFQNESYVF